jgi:predicted ester cyclase
MSELNALIARYYAAFNERRFHDAADMFSVDAEIQHRPNVPLRGPEGYMTSARLTTTSFPDLRLEVLRITRQGDTIVEVDLVAKGTHAGDWTAEGVGTVKASGQPKTIRVRETLEIRAGKITFSSLNYNLQDLFAAPGAPQ